MLLTTMATVVLVVLCHAASDADQAIQIVDDQALEDGLTDNVLSDDKRAAKIFRYGRAPGVFRYGKRAPSVFRYGKRAPAVFRYGRRSDDAMDDLLLMLVKPQSAFGSDGQHKRKIFRYGKRSDK